MKTVGARQPPRPQGATHTGGSELPEAGTAPGPSLELGPCPRPHLVGLEVVVQGELQLAQVLGLLLLLALALALCQARLRIIIILGG